MILGPLGLPLLVYEEVSTRVPTLLVCADAGCDQFARVYVQGVDLHLATRVQVATAASALPPRITAQFVNTKYVLFQHSTHTVDSTHYLLFHIVQLIYSKSFSCT